MDETEITNNEYRQFITVMLTDSVEALGEEYIMRDLFVQVDLSGWNIFIRLAHVESSRRTYHHTIRNCHYPTFPVWHTNKFATEVLFASATGKEESE